MNKHFSKFQLFTYSLPAMAMMLAMSAYAIISAFFLSNYAGSTAFAAENLIWPLVMIFSTFGLMIGTGSSAIIANKLGEKDKETASKYFSMFIYIGLVLGIILTIIGYFLVEPVAVMLGATGELLEISVYYGSVTIFAVPAYLLQMAFLVFFNTAGKPNMGFITTLICSGVVIVFDVILVAVMGLGLNGVLFTLVLTLYVGAIFPFIYFVRKNNSSALHLKNPVEVFKNENPSTIALTIKASLNGSSETVQQIAVSLVSLLCVFQLNRFIGESGIVAYGVLEYAWLVFNSLFIGFSVAIAPLMSYQQGAKNTVEMNSLFKNSIVVILVLSVVSFILSQIFASALVSCFVGYDQDLTNLAIYAFRIYSFSFLFVGLGIYGSSLFTSLGNGLISALIAFLRTLVFETIGLIMLPLIFGSDGIWFSSVLAEALAAILTIIFIFAKGKKYGILKRG